MPAYARKLITAADNEVATYLLTNRCIRGLYLIGNNKDRNYDHRKNWIEERLKYLIEECFFIDLLAFAILCNHLHKVVTTRPDQAKAATDEEIVNRWWKLFPRKINGQYHENPPPDLKDEWLSNSEWISIRRKRLSSISWLMATLCEPIARRANREDGVKGRFWEGRFDSRILLNEKAVLSASVYVDLNPMRAGMARNLEESVHTSIRIRMKSTRKDQSKKNSKFPINFANQSMQIKSSTPSTSIDRKDYIKLCLLRANEIHRKESGPQRNRILPWKDNYLELGMVRASRYAIGPPALILDFAKRRSVSRLYGMGNDL